MNLASHPLILDLDQSVGRLSEDEQRMPLGRWQEQIRFGCTSGQFEKFQKTLEFPPQHGCVFLGSGDYHHLSFMLLKRLQNGGDPFDVIVCDNHPDNMRYPFGIHCGSWVYHASRLPSVSHIHVIGITSPDIGARHCWENYLSPLLHGKVSYWSIHQKAGWLDLCGARNAHHSFDSADKLLEAFLPSITNSRQIYLSIDKDVFHQDLIKTNWDQGCFEFRHLENIISACTGKLLGADVTGEISYFKYQGIFKRILAGMDGLELPDPLKLAGWQDKQHQFNIKLLKLLDDHS